ncbi:MAG: ATP-binding protein [Acidobacteriota bacterium]
MARFQDLSFRSKVLVVALLPVLWAMGLVAVLFTLNLEGVWRSTVSAQTNLLRLDLLCREYQGEVREFVLLGEDETLGELEEIEGEFSEALATLGAPGGEARSVAAELQPLLRQLLESGADIVDSSRAAGNSGAPALDGAVEEKLDGFEGLETTLENRIDDLRAAAEDEVVQALAHFRGWIALSAALGLASAVALSLLLARALSTPIEALREASGRILDGDYRVAQKVTSRDEFGELAAGFDRACEEIRRLVAEKEGNLEALKLQQAQLIQSGKMAAVGELAAGVAHEINNPLSAVLTYSVLLRERAEQAPPGALDAVPKLIERLTLIETAGQRCRTIAQKLLSFSRRDDEERVPVDLQAVVDESLELVAATLRRGRIAVTTRMDQSLPVVMGSKTQLQQVLINLMNNAAYAMPEGGDLTISARPGRGGCEISVADSGVGIDPAVLERIYEPFVTTKPAGDGTGLGLSIVYGLVQNHGGEIRVDSRVGEGTTFVVWLPGAPERGALHA